MTGMKELEDRETLEAIRVRESTIDSAGLKSLASVVIQERDLQKAGGSLELTFSNATHGFVSLQRTIQKAGVSKIPFFLEFVMARCKLQPIWMFENTEGAVKLVLHWVLEGLNTSRGLRVKETVDALALALRAEVVTPSHHSVALEPSEPMVFLPRPEWVSGQTSGRWATAVQARDMVARFKSQLPSLD